MNKPEDNERIQLVGILRTLKKTQDEVADVLKMRKEKIGEIEKWLRTERLDEVEGIFVDYRLRKVIDEKLPAYELLPGDFIEAARLKPETILEHYRRDYSSNNSSSEDGLPEHRHDLLTANERLRENLKTLFTFEGTLHGSCLGGWIVLHGFSDTELPMENVEPLHARGLLSHLRHERKDLFTFGDWDHLKPKSKEITRELLDFLALVSARRRFKGRCDLCKD